MSRVSTAPSSSMESICSRESVSASRIGWTVFTSFLAGGVARCVGGGAVVAEGAVDGRGDVAADVACQSGEGLGIDGVECDGAGGDGRVEAQDVVLAYEVAYLFG